MKPRKLVTRRELAAAFEVTETTVSNWQRDGMPVERRKAGPRGNLYDLEACRDWRNGRRGGASGGEDGANVRDYNAERARLTHHQANIAELEAESRRGNLLPVEVVEGMFSHNIGAARARILGIVDKLRNRFPDTDPRLFEWLEELHREALDELAGERLPADIRDRMVSYHERLASAAEADAGSVGEPSRRNH